MSLDVIELAKKFLISYLDGKTCDYEVTHPWRKDSKFIILHSLRVHSYAMKIIENEFYDISNDDKLLIQTAAILHDIGKIHGNNEHAKYSAKIVKAWLDANKEAAFSINNIEKLIRIIETHSDKENNEDDLCSKILKDADILDEIGVLSIFMSSNRIDKNSPFFFNELLERLSTVEIKYCQEKMSLLNTGYAKTLLKNKMDFIEEFNQQLYFELEGTHDIRGLSPRSNIY